jgi:hypothetical protein
MCVTNESLTAIGTLVGGAAAVVAAVVGWRALGTWRTQLRARGRYDAAKRLLTASHDLAEKFHAARSPFMFGNDSPSGYSDKPSGQRSAAEDREVWTKFLTARWEPVRVASVAVQAIVPEIKALFPTDVANATADLFGPVTDYRVALDDYVRLTEESHSFHSLPEAMQERHHDEMVKVRHDVFSPGPNRDGSSDNALTNEFTQKQEALAKLLQPFIDVV